MPILTGSIGKKKWSVNYMTNPKINFEKLFDSIPPHKKTKTLTINDVKELMKLSDKELTEAVDYHWKSEELKELEANSHLLDSTLLIQFALEDHKIQLEKLSKKSNISIDTLKSIIKGKIFPWKLRVEEIFSLISALEIPIDDFIEGLLNKEIFIESKQLQISGLHLPRAKNLSQVKQKEAMLEMERQIAIQDEEEERETFIQDLKNLVNR